MTIICRDEGFKIRFAANYQTCLKFTSRKLSNRKCTRIIYDIDKLCLGSSFFTDDQVIFADSEEDIDYVLEKLEEECEA